MGATAGVVVLVRVTAKRGRGVMDVLEVAAVVLRPEVAGRAPVVRHEHRAVGSRFVVVGIAREAVRRGSGKQ